MSRLAPLLLFALLAGCERDVVRGRGPVPVWDAQGCAFVIQQSDTGGAFVYRAPELNRPECPRTMEPTP